MMSEFPDGQTGCRNANSSRIPLLPSTFLLRVEANRGCLQIVSSESGRASTLGKMELFSRAEKRFGWT